MIVRPSGRRNSQLAAGRALDGEAALVDEPVMVAAEVHEILEVRPAAARPVLDVVRVHARAIAAGEAASAVARGERPAQRRRDRAGLAPDVERPAVAVQERDDAGVAGQAPGRLRRERLPVGELAAPGRVRAPREGVRIDVHHHLMAVAAGP